MIKIQKMCKICDKVLLRRNKTGFCIKHIDKSGKNNSFYGKKHSEKTKNFASKKISALLLEKWKDPIYREKVISGTSKPRKESFSKEQSDRVARWYANYPEQKTLRSKLMKKYWVEGRIKPTINSINESKYERELRRCCKEIFKDKNVRKTTIKIEGRWYYPDIRIGKYHIVEFYGDYWHANPKKYGSDEIVIKRRNAAIKASDIWEMDKKRITALESNNFKIMIVWQSDFVENKLHVLDEIKKWYNKEKG